MTLEKPTLTNRVLIIQMQSQWEANGPEFVVLCVPSVIVKLDAILCIWV